MDWLPIFVILFVVFVFRFLKLEKKSFARLIIYSMSIGLLADYISVADGYVENMFLGFWIGFTLSIPATVLLVVLLIRLVKLRHKGIILVSVSAMFLNMILTFWLYDVRQGSGRISDMYGIFYMFGAMPALIIGFWFGWYIKKIIYQIQVKNETVKESNGSI